MNDIQYNATIERGRVMAKIDRQFALITAAMWLAVAAIVCAALIGAILLIDSAHASEPCDPADQIFANGFEIQLPDWWDCWPHLSPPPPGWVCP